MGFKGDYGNEPVFNITREHVALCLLVDTSGSMMGEPIRKVNDGINKMIRELANNECAKNVVEISIIEFNTEVNVVRDFQPVPLCQEVNLQAHGWTNMGDGIITAIDNLKARIRTYGEKATPVKKPWIFMLTDGYPESDDNFKTIESMNKAKSRLTEEKNKNNEKGKLIFWGVGTENADFSLLEEISTPGCWGKLDESNLYELFDWITKSMITISEAAPTAESVNVTPPPFIQIPLK